MGKMTKKKWGIVLSGMLCSLVFPLTVSAASMQDVAAMAAAVNGSGEMTAAHNCFLLEYGGSQVLISAYNQQWELASAIQVASLTGNGEAAVTVNDSMAGVALLDFSGSMTACPEGAVASLMALSEGDTVIYGGFDLAANVSDPEDALIFMEGQLTGFTEADGYTFGVLAEDFDAVFAGGPVFSSEGKLVGVLSSRGAVLPIDYIVNTVSPGSAGAGSGSGGESQGGGAGEETPGGGTGGTGGGTSGGGTGGETQGDGISADEGLSAVVPVLSVFFLVAFFGGIAAFVASLFVYQNREMKKRTNGEPEFKEMLSYLGQSGQPGGARALTGVGGYFQGRRLEISGRPVIFGRDASRCTAVYPSDTKGISGLHCQIVQSGNDVILTDCGSTYGTYLSDGRRLAPNTPCRLNSGDSFYLAEPCNTFRVI